MKSVMLSIQPKWCEKIAIGEKTIEVRKTRPKLKTPFKCYIYETNDARFNHKENKDIAQLALRLGLEQARGKVIGEFVCDRIEKLEWNNDGYGLLEEKRIIQQSCINEKDLYHYLQGAGYAWHISDLKIYNNQKELCDFRYYVDCENVTKPCSKCKYSSRECNGFLCCNNKITRPPQSWCYVE